MMDAENKQKQRETYVSQLKDNPVFQQLISGLEAEIKELQEEYFELEHGSEEEKTSFLKIKHFQEFLSNIKLKLENTR